MSIIEWTLLVALLLSVGYIIWIKKTPGLQPGEGTLDSLRKKFSAHVDAEVDTANVAIANMRDNAVAAVRAVVKPASPAAAASPSAASSPPSPTGGGSVLPSSVAAVAARPDQPQPEKAKMERPADLLERQILQQFACVGPENPAVRPAHDAEFMQYAAPNGKFFVQQRMYSAYWATLFNGGKLMSDAELTALPPVPAWMVTPGLPIPMESQSSAAWNKFVRTYGGHVHGVKDDASTAGLAALIAAVKAGDAQP